MQFILEPLYKIHSFVLGSQGKELGAMLEEIGVVSASPRLARSHALWRRCLDFEFSFLLPARPVLDILCVLVCTCRL